MAGNGGASVVPTSCAPFVPRRLVRLTLNQVVNQLRTTIGAAAADPLVKAFDLPDAAGRSFPPLSAPEEGTYVTEAVWAKSEGIGQAAAKYVFDNYAAVTGCKLADTTDACAQGYLMMLAEKAFRRPVAVLERDSLLQVYTEAKSFGAPIPEAVQQGVWAVLTSPHFIYRTEMGDAGTTGVPTAGTALTAYERASQLAFFLTDTGPDGPLTDAARQGTLATDAGVLAQATRLLASPAAQGNLQQAMFAYFGIANLTSVVIDPTKVPEYTVGVQNAMLRETQDFLTAALWRGKLNDLLLSRQTVVNPDLAKLYGIPFPAGATATAATFVPVELPEVRAGLLTQVGFITSRARTDTSSVVARGLAVNAAILCAGAPPPPPMTLTDQIESVTVMQADNTERERSVYRQTTAPCSACHPSFDPYGLILENFDLIGRYRTTDERGRPVDSTTTLPADAGGGQSKTAAAFARQVTSNGVFAACMARNLMKFALADGNVERGDCPVQVVTQRWKDGDQTFAALIREVATSPALSQRVKQ
ncbi:MAG: DUF1592 domain-containing protein [Verrucomicrobiota bacterium]